LFFKRLLASGKLQHGRHLFKWSNRWNILGFNFTKRDALSSVYKISMPHLQRTYIAENGQIESQIKNDKFWINFYAWKDGQYGARGPTELQWDVILQEE
jgi:hypothetical protein